MGISSQPAPHEFDTIPSSTSLLVPSSFLLLQLFLYEIRFFLVVKKNPKNVLFLSNVSITPTYNFFYVRDG